MKFYFCLIFCIIFLTGCASGHCGRDGKAIKMDSKREKVFIYKYDGSKQCEEGTDVDLDTMALELTGIKIFSMSKKSDGQIRVQVCGALTGVANVYEVSLSNLPKAEALGFKKWDF